ncbi:MAG: hypothetical protein DRO11_03705 [Methanobacteriota archaeon]|nr:MAG: hypothetical protein DRO11_03705 [Euryarchaeota archaeon]
MVVVRSIQPREKKFLLHLKYIYSTNLLIFLVVRLVHITINPRPQKKLITPKCVPARSSPKPSNRAQTWEKLKDNTQVFRGPGLGLSQPAGLVLP